MRSSPTLLLFGIACVVTACATRSVPPQHPDASATTTAAAACDSKAGSRFREMTWNEYYADVKERAWRRGAMVIWVHPPFVHKVAVNTAQPTACR